MSKKKSKLFMSLLSLAFCLGIMCFGVYAATSVSYTLSGHITYDVSDVFVDIETRHYLSTQTDLSLAKGEVTDVMQNIAISLESGTTSIDGVTELSSDHNKQSTLNNVGGEELPLTGPALNITYGAYSNTSGEEKAYVHYIAILVTNYAEEEINAILNLDSLYDLTGSNSKIFPYRTMENIPAKSGETNGVMSYVFALGLDQPAQSIEGVDFAGVELSVTRGNLDQYATEGLEYEYSEADDGYLVSKCTSNDTRVIIPSKHSDDGTNGEHPVVGTKSYLNPGAQQVCVYANMREVYLPHSFKKIGDSSFYGCQSLAFINIPSSVESLGRNVFSGCPADCIVYSKTDGSTYDFKNGTLTIHGEVSDNPAWYNNNINALIKKVIFNDGKITSIGDKAFRGCSNLTFIEIPNSVERIGEYAFMDCSNLKSIKIPSSVRSMERSAFGVSGPNNWKTIIFEDTTTPWTVNGKQITSTELSNPSTMKTYLTLKYSYYTWTKNI